MVFIYFRESSRSSLPESHRSSSSDDESTEVGKNTKHGKIKRGLGKLGNMFHKSSSPRKNQNSEAWSQELFTTPRPNLRSVGEKRVSVNMVLDQDLKDGIKENDNKSNPDCEELLLYGVLRMERLQILWTSTYVCLNPHPLKSPTSFTRRSKIGRAHV